ncbi:MAG: tetratricopeptide repeat protein [Gammaproteobacteria bacterium]|nr:tetratricopeptide repeat protein [Gammaproteobacteria bacterium]
MKKNVLPLLLSLGVACGGLLQTSVASAVEGFPACTLDFKKKPSGGLDEKTYKKLTGAQELLGKEQYGQALPILQELLTANAGKAYAEATILQNIGWIHAARNDYRKAVDAMQRAINTGALPGQVVQSTNLNLASLHLAMDDYPGALKILSNWFGCEKAPKPEAWLMLSQVYAQSNRYKEAIPPAVKAIETSPKPKESWYQHLLGLYWETNDFQKAAQTLRSLVEIYPAQKRYWTQLSGVYARINDDKNALAVLELAYRQNLLDKESELRQLASFYAFLDVPYKAAQVLEKAIKDGKLPGNEKNWNAVATNWRSAREFDKAIVAFGEAAKFSDSGEYYFLMAEMYNDKENWKAAIAALQNAFKKGGLKNAGFAYMRLGEAKMHLGAFKESINAFQSAAKYDKTAKVGAQWASYAAEREKIADLLKK